MADQKQMELMKQIIKYLIIGFSILATFFCFLKFISFDISKGIALVCILFLISSFFIDQKMKLLNIFLVLLPTLLFSLLLIKEINGLWFIIFLFFGILIINSYFTKTKFQKRILFPIATIIIIFLFQNNVIPNVLFEGLTQEITFSKISYQLEDLRTKQIVNQENNNNNNNKLVIFSFFNTWCAPCIEEFPELEKLDEEYKDIADIVLVCAGGMDKDKNKVLELVSRKKIDLKIFYDDNSTLYNKLNLNGVPSIVIVNAKNEIVHIHTGYNKSLNLVKHLGKIINENK